eukprot:CAMPEP_0171158378 /NCGR_PEP_ID=MMETSP0790-20130122/2473_1 /TAXON_ID=2925 /ORGANISM="Alexandrium catenella, Strain OF101" /LENGTH=279 /DNA_ID=CAMNT_0011622803 /DNA_START=1 /DNA_END=839 /DNA_ORIENTATION=+
MALAMPIRDCSEEPAVRRGDGASRSHGLRRRRLSALLRLLLLLVRDGELVLLAGVEVPVAQEVDGELVREHRGNREHGRRSGEHQQEVHDAEEAEGPLDLHDDVDAVAVLDDSPVGVAAGPLHGLLLHLVHGSDGDLVPVLDLGVAKGGGERVEVVVDHLDVEHDAGLAQGVPVEVPRGVQRHAREAQELCEREHVAVGYREGGGLALRRRRAARRRDLEQDLPGAASAAREGDAAPAGPFFSASSSGRGPARTALAQDAGDLPSPVAAGALLGAEDRP